jgi:hypothetical protein
MAAKLILCTVVLLLLGVNAEISFSDDFLQGFESGIYLRTAKDREEYGCPEPRADGAFMGLPDLKAPLKMMVAFV